MRSRMATSSHGQTCRDFQARTLASGVLRCGGLNELEESRFPDTSGCRRSHRASAVLASWRYSLARHASLSPPRRPRHMAKNSVWIDAPALPISWHHGWWFGCDISSSGTTNYCRLVGADGKQINAGEYLPCGRGSPIPESSMLLVPPPPRSFGMWLADNRLSSLSPIGYLSDGDILLPAAAIDRCRELTRVRR